MMRPTQRFALLVVAVLLAGCPSISMIQMDNEWRDSYKSMFDTDPAISATNTVELRLLDLSHRAKAAGDEAAAKQTADAISFYRIAALAGWKAGLQKDTPDQKAAADPLALTLAAGQEACQKLEGGAKSRPLDCALFRYIRVLAWHDRVVASMTWYETYRLRRGATLVGEAEKTLASDSYKTLGMLFTELDTADADTETYPVPSEFRARFIGENRVAIHCNISKVENALLVSAGEAEQAGYTAKLAARVKTLQGLGLTPDCANIQLPRGNYRPATLLTGKKT